MITYVRHNNIDKNKWDDCIAESSNGIVYAYSWYLDIVSPKWEALIENDYESVFPLTINSKYGIDYLFPPFFTQQLGLFSRTKITREKLNLFLSSVPKKVRFIEINLNSKNIFDTPGFAQSKNLTHHLSLRNSYEKICNSYHVNLKRNLKKAVKLNQHVIKDVDPQKIIKLFRANKGKEISTLKDKNYKTFLRTIEAAAQRNCLEIYGVSTGSQLTAGAFFIESNNKSIFIFSGTNKEGKENFSMPLLIDAFIKAHSETILTLDFEGSNNLNLARFYKSFGAEEVVYLQIKKNNLPYPLKWIKK